MSYATSITPSLNFLGSRAALLYQGALAQYDDHPPEKKGRSCCDKKGRSRCKAAYCAVEVEEDEGQYQEGPEIQCLTPTKSRVLDDVFPLSDREDHCHKRGQQYGMAYEPTD